MIKRMVIWTLLLIMVSSVSYGAGRYQEIRALLADDIKIFVNEKQVQLTDTDGSILVPISYNGRTYLPVRSVAALVSYDVSWDGIGKTISLDSSDGSSTEEESGYASIAATAYSTGIALQSKDYTALAKLAHPVKGIRFSINGSVVAETDIVLKKAELERSDAGDRTYTWGVEDGSSAPMIKTLNDFMERFQKDFENPVRTGWNVRVTGLGIQNQPQYETAIIEGGETLYGECEFVEYYFEGTSRQEFDWNSYVLIFEKYQDKYYLTGILHNYWLI